MDPKLRARKLSLAGAESSVEPPAGRHIVTWPQVHSPHE